MDSDYDRNAVPGELDELITWLSNTSYCAEILDGENPQKSWLSEGDIETRLQNLTKKVPPTFRSHHWLYVLPFLNQLGLKTCRKMWSDSSKFRKLIEDLVRAWHQKIVDYAAQSAHEPKVLGYGRTNDNPQDHVPRDAEDWVKVVGYFCPDLLTEAQRSEYQSTIDSEELRTPYTPSHSMIPLTPNTSFAASGSTFPQTPESKQPDRSGDTVNTF